VLSVILLKDLKWNNVGLGSHPSRPRGCPAPNRAEGKAWSWGGGSCRVTRCHMHADGTCFPQPRLLPRLPARRLLWDELPSETAGASLSSPRCWAWRPPSEPLGRIPDSGEGVLIGGGVIGPLGDNRARLGPKAILNTWASYMLP